jgi:hypothetical protein
MAVNASGIHAAGIHQPLSTSSAIRSPRKHKLQAQRTRVELSYISCSTLCRTSQQ